MNDLQILLLTIILGSTLALILYISKLFKRKEEENEVTPTPEPHEQILDDNTKKQSLNDETTAYSKAKNFKKPEKHLAFSHPWLLTNLKGHSGRVMDLSISSNGKYIASTSEDRSVLIWFFKDLTSKEHKTWRGNVDFDHGIKVSWSPDSKAFIVHKASANKVEVYKMNKKEPGGGPPQILAAPIDFEPLQFDLIALQFSSNGKYIMTCTDKSTLIIWSLKGDKYAEIETYHMNINYCAKISTCGRFVGTSGFTPDVEIYEVKFTKTGEFVKIERAFSLTGHNSGVFAFDFNADSTKMVTVSKDGKIRLFDTNIEYSKGQDPTLLVSRPIDCVSEMTHLGGALISLSPDSRSVALAFGKELRFFSGSDLKPLGIIERVHSASITNISFDAESKYLITSGDKHLRVFHNIPGMRETIRDFECKVKEANTQAKKELLEKQINEARASLKRVLGDTV
ncbi:transducin beta-like protein 2 [Lepeophtheirus salmonis]|uniref:transducin beta-like protein 2 n=1 Tax=Lepeophtheirus salmonis TaxID=72036 RepID=UPI001AE4A12E|nr:transducin beta-like protein 2 [Lepeophtheirus salmonis]